MKKTTIFQCDNILLLMLIVLSVIPYYAAYKHQVYLIDDAYITLTYSKNIVLGKGFVYNHLPRSLGTTTPLFALIIGFLSVVLKSIHHNISVNSVAVFFTATCWVSTAWIFFFERETWRLTKSEAFIFAMLVIVNQHWIHLLGQESFFFSFLLVLMITFFYKKHFVTAGLLTGLLFATRGEGILVSFVISFLIFIPLRQLDFKNKFFFFLKYITGLIIVLLVYFAFSKLYFGSFLPSTLHVKQIQYNLKEWSGMRLNILEAIFKWFPASFATNYFNLPLLPPFLLIIGVACSFTKDFRFILFLPWIFLYIAGYQFLQVQVYGWYLIPVLFVAYLYFSLGAIRVKSWLDRVFFLKSNTKYFSTCIILFFITCSALKLTETINIYPGDVKAKTYLELSRWISENTLPTSSVACFEVGYFGFYTDNKIIDILGLVSPEMVKYVKNSNFKAGFFSLSPDYFVYLSEANWLLGGIISSNEFKSSYIDMARFKSFTSSGEAIIYKKILD